MGGVAMWYFMLHSGVRATIAGVLLAFAMLLAMAEISHLLIFFQIFYINHLFFYSAIVRYSKYMH